jgi:predicted dehydrogenase
MIRNLALLPLLCFFLAIPLRAQEPTIAVVGMVHSHVWGHLSKMIRGEPARLVGVAEQESVLVDEAVKAGLSRDLVYTDYKKMLDEKKPTVVWAFVENNRHLEIIEYCAPRKIHVMFEKPLASTYKDALAIQRLAQQHGIKVMVNYQMAWWPTMHALKTKLDSGELGTVWRLHGIVGHGGPGSGTGRNKFFFDWLTDPEQNGAGALMDFGCYNALWSLMYLGKPTSVFAHTIQLRPEEFPKVEDSSAILLTYPKGVALLEGSWDLPHSFQQVEVFGLRGSVFADRREANFRPARQAPQTLPNPDLQPHELEPIAYMLECIRTNTDPAGMVSMEYNVGVNEIIEAAKMSVTTGKPVSLPLQ